MWVSLIIKHALVIVDISIHHRLNEILAQMLARRK